MIKKFNVSDIQLTQSFSLSMDAGLVSTEIFGCYDSMWFIHSNSSRVVSNGGMVICGKCTTTPFSTNSGKTTFDEFSLPGTIWEEHTFFIFLDGSKVNMNMRITIIAIIFMCKT